MVLTMQMITFVTNATVLFNIVFNLKNNLLFLVFKTMLNLHLSCGNITSFFIRLLIIFSFDSENSSCTIISFYSLNSCSGIIRSFIVLLKFSAVLLIKLLGRLANRTFLVRRFTSYLKSVPILSALCNYPVKRLLL